MDIFFLITILIVIAAGSGVLTFWVGRKLSPVFKAIILLVISAVLLGLLISTTAVTWGVTYLIMFACGLLFCAYIIWRKHGTTSLNRQIRSE